MRESQQSQPDSSYTGAQDASSSTSEFNAKAFLIRQILSQIGTSMPVQVMSVTNSGGVSPVGSVDVLPLVNQVDGNGNPMPHGTIHGLPYFRIQGGLNAIIIDPVVGDIGTAIFASRDISAVKNKKGQANPGSFRQFDMADGMYFGGFLNAAPTQYIQFVDDAINIVATSKISLTAATSISLNASEVVTNITNIG